jgi:hypothetical protein
VDADVADVGCRGVEGSYHVAHDPDERHVLSPAGELASTF